MTTHDERSSCPDVEVQYVGEVVFGPWPDFQGDYTAMRINDLDELIQKLIKIRNETYLDTVAEAIFDAQFEGTGHTIDSLHRPDVDQYRRMAQAAIDAIHR